MSRRKISLDEFLAAIAQYSDSHKVNPTDSPVGMCRYTDSNDKKRHCIFGQIMADLGVPPQPSWEGSGASNLIIGDPTIPREPALSGVFLKRDEKVICSIAEALQRLADGDYNSGRLQWRTAIRRVEALLADTSNDYPPAALAAWRKVFA
jgi:hypothetical protein